MNSQSCLDEMVLRNYTLGLISADDEALITDHLQHCFDCESRMEALEANDDSLLSSLRVDVGDQPAGLAVTCDTEHRNSDPMTGQAHDHSVANYENAIACVKQIGSLAPSGSCPAADDLAPGVLVRDYEIVKLIGVGGMGRVYKAIHRRLGKCVALKILPASRLRDPAAVHRFQREMKAVGALANPHIVRATDAGEEGGVYFLAMEYIDGLDLSTLVETLGPLGVADACEMVRQAALGLEHARASGLVHRDIKPSNLIVNRDGVVQILDLGLALLSEHHGPDAELTMTGQFMGTLDYVAPEQGDDCREVDIRADIYGLGATMFKLLTGNAPFAFGHNDSPYQKAKRWATMPVPSLRLRRSEVSPGLEALVEKMLARDPAQRFHTPQEVSDELAPYAEGAELGELLARGVAQAPDAAARRNRRNTAFHPVVPPKALEQRPARGGRIRRFVFAALLIAGIAALGGLMWIQLDKGQLVIDNQADDIKIVVKRGATVVDSLDIKSGRNQVSLRTGRYEVLIVGPHDGLQMNANTITIHRGKERVVSITRQPESSDSKLVTGMQEVTAGHDSEPVFKGKSYAEWARLAATERDLTALNGVIPALVTLTRPENQKETIRLILEICHRPGLFVKSMWSGRGSGLSVDAVRDMKVGTEAAAFLGQELSRGDGSIALNLVNLINLDEAAGLIPHILPLCNHSNNLTRSAACQAIYRFARESPEGIAVHQEDIEKVILKVIQHPEEDFELHCSFDYSCASARALDIEPSKVAEAIRALLKSSDAAWIRFAIVQAALDKKAGALVVPDLTQLLKTSDSGKWREIRSDFLERWTRELNFRSTHGTYDPSQDLGMYSAAERRIPSDSIHQLVMMALQFIGHDASEAIPTLNQIRLSSTTSKVERELAEKTILALGGNSAPEAVEE